jgi:hypothetical protein
MEIKVDPKKKTEHITKREELGLDRYEMDNQEESLNDIEEDNEYE